VRRRASNDVRDFSGWLTPDNKFLHRKDSHASTLKDHGVDVSEVEPLLDGYAWLMQHQHLLTCDVHYSHFHRIKRVLEDLLGKTHHTVLLVDFEILNDNLRITKSQIVEYNHGFLD
jgi:hypothetical protein